ncbi:GNAT family N-acetyltransferase [Streptacidiphilus sp. BW17]|uniref:GNAT family N-acetyltransferase n=1 Tax=Streptacidiphilus sp. BW17 TaxID=3156274 RepID=UPI0035149F56
MPERTQLTRWQAEPGRTAVQDEWGRVVADFVRVAVTSGRTDAGTGDGTDAGTGDRTGDGVGFWWADDLRPRCPDLAHAARVVGEVLAGWTLDVRVASAETDFAELLHRSAEAFGRHAHHYLWDFALMRPDPRWHEPELPHGLTLAAPGEVGGRRLFRLHQRAYPPGHPDHPAGDPDWFASMVQGRLFGELLDGSAVALAPGGRPVAAVLVAQRSSCLAGDGPGVVDIFRDPAHAPQGLGAALLRRALARTAQAGLPTLRLEVTEGNPARRVYERTGFAYSGSSRRLRLPGGTSRPQVRGSVPQPVR